MSVPPPAAPPDKTRPLTLVEAIIPVAVLIILIVSSVLLFGDDGFKGPNQIALVLAGLTVAAVARRAGHSLESLNQAAVGSISSGMSAILILFAVGALIGTWAISGTLVAMVYFGMQYLSPSYFPFSAFLICAFVSTCLGSSWTTAGTIGVGFMGMATNMGMDPAVTAGAIISGAYVGEMISPLSDTGNLASGSAGVPLYTHLREAAVPTSFAFILTALFFWFLSAPVEPQLNDEIAVIQANFNMSVWLFLPLVVVMVMAFRRTAPFTTIMVGALVGLLIAVITAPHRVAAFGNPAGDLPTWLGVVKGSWLVLASGYVSNIGHPTLDTLMSRGGMESMLHTVWLVIAALGFGGVAEKSGVLTRLIEPILGMTKSAWATITALVASIVATNIVTADQYLALVLPAQMFRSAMAKLGFAPFVLTRTVAAAGTPTSALVPWNSCGAFMSAALGVSTVHYLPYAAFNITIPLMVIFLSAIGVRMVRQPVVE